jgi:hypothetical protein
VSAVQSIDLLNWLRANCARYEFDVVALYRREGDHPWPLRADDPADLEQKLAVGGHFLPLPKEPAALANIVEVSVADFILEEADQEPGLVAVRGTERGYPDIEFSGTALGDAYYAVDVKVARRAKSGTRTQSRITLYTGNTYFRYPTLHWPGTFRPFADYKQHLDVIAVYTLDEERTNRVAELELIVEEAWRIGSRQRSSTTREYIGAVDSIAALKAGKGEFTSEQEFYDYWRKYRFRIGPSIERVLKKLLAEQG